MLCVTLCCGHNYCATQYPPWHSFAQIDASFRRQFFHVSCCSFFALNSGRPAERNRLSSLSKVFSKKCPRASRARGGICLSLSMFQRVEHMKRRREPKLLFQFSLKRREQHKQQEVKAQRRSNSLSRYTCTCYRHDGDAVCWIYGMKGDLRQEFVRKYPRNSSGNNTVLT